MKIMKINFLYFKFNKLLFCFNIYLFRFKNTVISNFFIIIELKIKISIIKNKQFYKRFRNKKIFFFNLKIVFLN